MGDVVSQGTECSVAQFELVQIECEIVRCKSINGGDEVEDVVLTRFGGYRNVVYERVRIREVVEGGGSHCCITNVRCLRPNGRRQTPLWVKAVVR